jgi:ATP-dependent Clp protease adapter protein ClpS
MQDCNHGEFFELQLYNDQDNFKYYVAEQLVKVAGLTELQAFQVMQQARLTGQAMKVPNTINKPCKPRDCH